VTGVKKNANGEITHYVINDTGTGQVARQVTAEQYEGSLLKAPATVTEKPISYGGSTAKAQRRADAKTQKAETTSKSETTGSKMTEAEATQETATLGSKKAKTGGESEPEGNAPKSSATNESAALQRNTGEKDFTNVSSQNDTPESREISETISAPVRELYGRQPNREFNRSAIRRIKKNMQQEGFDPDSPIRVAEIDGRKIIIDGHHRARAAGAAGIKNVPVIIEEISPEKASLYGQHAAEASQSLGLDYRWYNPYAPKPY
jgi:ParB-like nuclease domain